MTGGLQIHPSIPESLLLQGTPLGLTQGPGAEGRCILLLLSLE